MDAVANTQDRPWWRECALVVSAAAALLALTPVGLAIDAALAQPPAAPVTAEAPAAEAGAHGDH